MRKFRLTIEQKSRLALAFVAGTLLALAFPKFEISGLAWIAPGVLLLAGYGASRGAAFRAGYLSGFIYYLITLYWLLFIPLKFLPIVGWIALSMYLALFPALWLSFSWRLFPRSAAVPLHRSPFAPELAEAFRRTSWSARMIWCIQVAALWVALEMLLGRFLSGFPWEFLGVSQYKIIPLIQIAEFTGIYGISFLLVWFSAGLLCAVFALTRYPGPRAGWAKEVATPLIAVLIACVYGIREIGNHREPARTINVALIQPSIPQTLIWDPSENENRFRQLLELSRSALTNESDLLIWPEASVPNMVRHHEDTGAAVRDLVTEYKIWAILGSDDAELRPGGSGLADVDYFNSAFAISPEGELKGIYKKRRLVIFGEYVPFVKQLPFLKMFSPAGESGFTAGEEAVAFDLDSLGVVASVLICFEDVFPHLVRDYVQADTDFLVNLTNNGWFGESAAQWQHAASAAFRAVENRIPLVRCANNGLTCWVDSLGRMHEVYFPGTKDIYGPGVKRAEVPVLAPGEQRHLTFYTRYGDVFGWTCLGFTTLRLISVTLIVRRAAKYVTYESSKKSGFY